MSDDLFARLAAPFRPEQVSWRVGAMNRDKTKAMALAYIDARDVMARFDEVCGPAGWERKHPHVDKTTTCEIGVWVEGRGWVVKADGAGDTAVEAEKGSLSDSFKRAAVNWGVGRYLYDLPSPWVELDDRKQIKPEEMRKLEGLLRGRAPPPPKADPIRPEETGLYIAAKAAIDMCQDDAELDLWGKDNAVSMERMKAEAGPVYDAVKRYYATRKRALTATREAA